MHIKLKYGIGYKELGIPLKNVIDILKLKSIHGNENPDQLVKEKLNSPIGTEPLSKLIDKKNPKNLVILVSDQTRPFPYKKLPKVLVDEIFLTNIKKGRIRFVIANGTHRKMTENEIRSLYGNWVVDNFNFENHDCRANNLVYYGKMKSGNELWINKTVANADFLITIGVIVPHYFAGFSGGRKSILPGVCGYETIRANHSNIIYDNAKLGRLKGNPVHLEMCEAAHKVGIDFCVNMVVNNKDEFVQCFAGDIDKVFQTGVEYFKRDHSVKFNQLADVVFVSAGGYPKDVDLNLSRKCANNVFDLTKQGGTIVLVAECIDGVGQAEMEKILLSVKNLDELFAIKKEDIQVDEHRAFGIGKCLKKADILFLSSMNPEKVKELHLIPMSSLKDCINFILKKHNKNYKSYIVPDGLKFFPVLKK